VTLLGDARAGHVPGPAEAAAGNSAPAAASPAVATVILGIAAARLARKRALAG